MLSSPKAGQKCQLWYAEKKRGWLFPYHASLAEIILPGRGRPRNHLVKLEGGRLVIVPAGHLRKVEKDYNMCLMGPGIFVCKLPNWAG